LVICIFSSSNLDGTIVMTDNHEKEMREYSDEVRKEADERFESMSVNGRFVFSPLQSSV